MANFYYANSPFNWIVSENVVEYPIIVVAGPYVNWRMNGPLGVTISSTTGEISGVPLRKASSPVTYTVTATKDSQDYTTTITVSSIVLPTYFAMIVQVPYFDYVSYENASYTVKLPYLNPTNPLYNSAYSGTIDWGDGTTNSNGYDALQCQHTYAVAGTYTVTIKDDGPSNWQINGWNSYEQIILPGNGGAISYITDILSFGQYFDFGPDLGGQFAYGVKLTHIAEMKQLIKPSFTNLSRMFIICVSLVLVDDISDWDVSLIEDMSYIFYLAQVFNQPLNDWNTVEVKNMNNMFVQARLFNQPLNNWKTDNVTNMSFMFYYAEKFNQDIDTNVTNGTWNTSNVINMSYMFYIAYAFNTSINNWNVSNVQNINGMFYFANAFNQPLNLWPISKQLQQAFNFIYNDVYTPQNLDGIYNGWYISLLNDASPGGYPSVNLSTNICYTKNSKVNRQNIIDSFGWFIFDNGIVSELYNNGAPFNWTFLTDIGGPITPSPTMAQPIQAPFIKCSILPPLPKGLTFNPSTLAISGTPVRAVTNAYFTITFTDANNIVYNEIINVTILSPTYFAMIVQVPYLDVFTNESTYTVKLPYLDPNAYATTYSGTINWGDGTSNANGYAALLCQHTYALPGNYTVTIKDTDMITPWQITGWNSGVQYIAQGYGGFISYITDILSFGENFDFGPDLGGQFTYALKLTHIPAMKELITPTITSFLGMFANCLYLTSVDDIYYWDTSSVTNMGYMFNNTLQFNNNISNWNVRKVKNMDYMFADALAFKQPLYWSISSELVTARNFIVNEVYLPYNLTTLYFFFYSSLLSESNNFPFRTFPPVIFNAPKTNYTSFASTTRQNISFTFGWSITDAGELSALYNNGNSFNWTVLTDIGGSIGPTPAPAGPITNCLITPALPMGLTFDSVTASISGTPLRAVNNKIYTIRFTDTNSTVYEEVINVTIFLPTYFAMQIYTPPNKIVKLPYLDPASVYNSNYAGTINWGDGVETPNTYDYREHTYASAGNYTITIKDDGPFPWLIKGWNSFTSGSPINYITDILSFGQNFDFGPDNDGYFIDGLQLTHIAAMKDLLLNRTTLGLLFYNCSVLTSVDDISSWDTTSVTNMSSTFENATLFNQNISSWNTTNVTVMSNMFSSASNFDQPINSNLFLNTWNTSNVTIMNSMFLGASQFDKPINGWNTGNVLNMQNMFTSATSFKQPIGSWNTVNVTNMAGMFTFAFMFNQPLNSWNTSNIENMENMFLGANAFNQDIGGWITSSVQNMQNMFLGAITFNQDIGGWSISSLLNANQFINNTVFSPTNLDNLYNGWSNSATINNSVPFGALASYYTSNGRTSRANLVNLRSWQITDLGEISILYNSGQPFQFNRNVSVGTIVPTINGRFDLYSINTPLPSGLAFNTTNGFITGTPTQYVVVPQTFTVTAYFTDDHASQANTTFTVQVNLPSLPLIFSATITILNDGNNIIRLPYLANGTYIPANGYIDWGDGSIPSDNSYVNRVHMYPAGANTYTLQIFGTLLNGWNFLQSDGKLDTMTAITFMEPYLFNFGTLPNQDVGYFFTNCSKLQTLPTLISFLSNRTNYSHAFENCLVLNSFPNINNWPVTTVTDMSYMFHNAAAFNQNISAWVPVNVTTFEKFLTGATAFYTHYLDLLYNVWSLSPLQQYCLFDASTSYSAASAVQRAYLAGSPTPLFKNSKINTLNGSPGLGWTINDGSIASITYPSGGYTFTLNEVITTDPPITNPVNGYQLFYSNYPPFSGIQFDQLTGSVIKTPSLAGSSYNYTIIALANGYYTGNPVQVTTQVSITVNDIKYPVTNLTLYKNVEMSTQEPIVSGSYIYYQLVPSFAANSGLNFNPNNGFISGTPLYTQSLVSYSIIGFRSNGQQDTYADVLSITVLPRPSISYKPSKKTLLIGSTISPIIPILEDVPVSVSQMGYSITPALPSGLIFNTLTAVISGTLTTKATSKNYTVSINAVPVNTRLTLITVYFYYPAVPILDLLVTIEPIHIITLQTEFTSFTVSPALPEGLRINKFTGTITGTPTEISFLTGYTITGVLIDGQFSTYVLYLQVCNLQVAGCPPKVLKTANTFFGGNVNIVTVGNTNAFKYATLVRTRNPRQGQNIIVSNPLASQLPVPPRNSF